MKNVYLNRSILFLVIIILSSNYLLGVDGSGTIVSGGIPRSFNFHSPGTSVGSYLPVMLVFHGDGGSGTGVEAYTGFDALADANNFLVVYPDAINCTWNRYADTINTGASCATSINENKSNVDFSIFPNPSDGTFSITSPYQPVNAKLFDLLGNEIMITKTDANSYSFTSAPSGIYILKIYTPEGLQATRKIIVQ